MPQPTKNYFTSPNYQYWLSALAIEAILAISMVSPKSWQNETITKLGTDYHNVFVVINVLLWGAHALEMFIAVYLCRQKGIMHPSVIRLWTIQTLFLGMFSLKLLIDYQPPVHTDEHKSTKKTK